MSTGLNQLLILKVLEYYQQTELNRFDFVGADTESIARFKSTFNLPLVPLYSVSKSRGAVRLGLQLKKYLK